MMTPFSLPRWSLLDALRDWLRPSPYARDLAFLEKCRGEEMERLRAHVRGRPEDLRWLVGREPYSSELLCHMLAVTDVDRRKLPEKTMRELERTCSRCLDKMHCADEIGTGRAPRTFGSFCPNAETLKGLQAKT